MSKGLEALQSLFDTMPFAFLESNTMKELKIIEKELKRLEELEKAFDSLSKDDEKAKKLLSKEIEKNRAFEIIKNNLNVDEILLAVKGVCKASDYDLLKEVLNA